MLSIICPTVAGREASLERCRRSYAHHTHVPYEFIVITNEPTCGAAWIQGAALASGRYLHFTADDLEVTSSSWLTTAAIALKLGYYPAPVIRFPDDHPERAGLIDYGGPKFSEASHPDWTYYPISVIPTMYKHQYDEWGMHSDLHYFSDNWFSFVARELGVETVVRTGYEFVHHYAPRSHDLGSNESLKAAQGLMFKQHFDERFGHAPKPVPSGQAR